MRGRSECAFWPAGEIAQQEEDWIMLDWIGDILDAIWDFVEEVFDFLFGWLF